MPAHSVWAIGDERGGLQFLARGELHSLDPEVRHHAEVTALVFSPDGTRLVSAGEDGSILVIDPVSHRVVGRAELPLDWATHLAVDAERDQIIAETTRGQRVTFAWAAEP